MKRIFALILATFFVLSCASERISLKPENNMVKVPMPPGSYGYVFSDNYEITDFGIVNLENEQSIEYPSIKR